MPSKGSKSVDQLNADISIKSGKIAFVLCLFFGWLGAHQFYAGKRNIGWIYLIITLVMPIVLIVYLTLFFYFINMCWMQAHTIIDKLMPQPVNSLNNLGAVTGILVCSGIICFRSVAMRWTWLIISICMALRVFCDLTLIARNKFQDSNHRPLIFTTSFRFFWMELTIILGVLFCIVIPASLLLFLFANYDGISTSNLLQ
jgi:TM2 domain-containing membrane protein YozV